MRKLNHIVYCDGNLTCPRCGRPMCIGCVTCENNTANSKAVGTCLICSGWLTLNDIILHPAKKKIRAFRTGVVRSPDHNRTKRPTTLRPTEKEVTEALYTVVKNRQSRALNYAVNYAEAGIGMTGYELEVQCLYVLGNMTSWRGDEAKSVRETLKAFTKKNKSRR